MSPTLRILRYQLREALRGRWVMAYGAFFLLVTEALFRMGGEGERVLLSLANLVLFVVPLVTLVLGTIYLYGAREFNEVLLAQPVGRTQLFTGLYAGLALPLAGAFLAGTALPFLLHGSPARLRVLLVTWTTGVLLTFVFAALAFVVAVLFEDRLRGVGAAVLVWLALAVLYDGAVLLAASAFYDYPLERPLLVVMVLNPIDLGRVLLLLQFDTAALMGYTGAVFERFFGTALGIGVSLLALGLWVAVPFTLGLARFRHRDLS